MHAKIVVRGQVRVSNFQIRVESKFANGRRFTAKSAVLFSDPDSPESCMRTNFEYIASLRRRVRPS